MARRTMVSAKRARNLDASLDAALEPPRPKLQKRLCIHAAFDAAYTWTQKNRILHKKAQREAERWVTVAKRDIQMYNKRTRMLRLLLHSPYMEPHTFTVLHERLRAVRREERERNRLLFRQYCLLDQQRGVLIQSADPILRFVYELLPPELFGLVYQYL